MFVQNGRVSKPLQERTHPSHYRLEETVQVRSLETEVKTVALKRRPQGQQKVQETQRREVGTVVPSTIHQEGCEAV